MTHERYSIAIHPDGPIEVLERSTDIPDAWIVIAPNFQRIEDARSFIAGLQAAAERLQPKGGAA